MKPSKTPFSYRPIKVGLILLFLALFTSAAGLYKSPVHYSQSGTMGVGVHVLGNESFEYNHTDAVRTLELSSKNASVVLRWEGSPDYPFKLTTNITIRPQGRPIINVTSGNVTYTYNVTAWEYPYSSLALPSLVFAIMGTILVFTGYIKFKQEGMTDEGA